MRKDDRIVNITSIGCTERGIDSIYDLVQNSISQNCDIVLLPEACLGVHTIVTPDGPEVRLMGKLAAEYSTHIVFPVLRQGGKTGCLNSSILIDRSGSVIAIYDKMYPYWSEFDLNPPVSPGEDTVVVETDIGRIGMAICFDANFPAVFNSLAEKRAELVLWSSAYSAGTSLQAHAINHNYIIVTSTLVPDCLVYDITGQEIYYQKGNSDINISHITLDMDRCIFHENFNQDKLARLLAEHSDDVESDMHLPREQWFTLKARKPEISAREYAALYNMEELSSYKRRSAREIDKLRCEPDKIRIQ